MASVKVMWADVGMCEDDVGMWEMCVFIWCTQGLQRDFYRGGGGGQITVFLHICNSVSVSSYTLSYYSYYRTQKGVGVEGEGVGHGTWGCTHKDSAFINVTMGV